MGNIFVLREKRATSCLLFRPRSVLSVYSETSASHETVCFLFPYARSFPIRSRRILPIPLFRTCLYLSIRLYVFLFPSTCLTLLVAAISLPATPSHACLRFSFIKLIAPTKPKKHVVWGVTREYRVGKHGNVDRL